MTEQSFKDLERQGWRERAQVYMNLTGPVTTQGMPALLDSVRTHAGIRLLDVCCGPGYGAGAAAALGADAAGIDFALEMVEVAREVFPNATFTLGDAEALEAKDASYDAVICPFGVFHLADPDAAFAEACRVLKPGGRYGFTTWYGPDKSPLFAIILQAIKEHGTMDVGLPPSPPPFRFAASEACHESLQSLGFVGIELRELPIELRVAAGTFMDFMRRFGVRIVMVLERQSEEAKAAIEAAIEQNLQRFVHDGTIVVPLPAVLVSAQKPK
jgi:SAM-dependent methyltransferase